MYAARFVGDRPADAIYRSLCALQFWRVHRFWPNFVRPRRFSEKLWSRMLHVRDPELTALSDKLRVRDYVATRVGSDCLIPLLWSGKDPEEIPFDDLPTKYVVKATHGCSFVILVRDEEQGNPTQIKSMVSEWLSRNYAQDVFLGIEWAYRNISPSIMIEEFLEENGTVPVDYKFWCFSGRVECVTAHFDRFVGQTTRAFDRDGAPTDFGFLPEPRGDNLRPENWSAMLQLAETLADGFDFIRVDLYNVDGKIRFGELTFYPGGASVMCAPGRWDHILGEKWKGSGI